MSNIKIQFYIIHSKVCEIRTNTMNMMINAIKSSSGNLFGETNVTVVNDHDFDQINGEVVKKFVRADKADIGNPMFEQLHQNLTIRQVSNISNHVACLQKALEKSKEYDYFVVLEDDSLLASNFMEKLHKVVSENKDLASYDMVMFGLPSNEKIDESNATDPKLINAITTHRILLTTDSYLIPATKVSKVLTNLLPVRFPTNIQYSYLATVKGVDIGMTVPNIAVNGSKLGIYLSTVEVNNVLFLNHEYMTMYALVNKHTLKKEEIQTVENIWNNVKYKNHPDFLHLHALLHVHKQDYKKAKEIYEMAFNIYIQNGCPVNGTRNDFLVHFLDIFKHFQTE